MSSRHGRGRRRGRAGSRGSGAGDGAGAGAGSAGGAETIKVMARVRPFLSREGLCSDITTVKGSTLTIRGSATGPSRYRFDRVFSQSAGQRDVFALVEPLLDAAFAGYNTTVFAYGQTGTGKTHTMLGVDMWSMAVKDIAAQSAATDRRRDAATHVSVSAATVLDTAARHKKEWGIIPRAMQHIFRTVAANADSAVYVVKVAYLELYNEKVFDLLRFGGDTNKSRSGPGLDIWHHKAQIPVTSETDVLALLWRGAQNRAISATDMNEHSSRSHTILQVMLEKKTRDRSSADAPAVVTRSKINLVDLAGSEKLKTHVSVSERRLQELTSINQSLSNLGNCIRALGQAGRSHIPYRNSKLTRLLQDSLGGNTKTTFIVTLSPSEDALEETLSTLQFANRAKQVTVHASVNETLDDESVIRQQAHEIARLKKLLQAAARTGVASPRRAPARARRSDSQDGGGSGPDGHGDAASASTATSTLDDDAREDLFRLKQDNLRLGKQLQRVQAELLDAREDNRALLQAVAERGMSAAALLEGRQDDTDAGGADEVGAALELLEMQTQAVERHRQVLERAQNDCDMKEQLLEKYHAWLRTLPLSDDADARSEDSAEESSPTSSTVRGRLHLLEWSVLMQRDELARSKRLFVRDITDLQALLLDKSAELEAAERKLLMHKGNGDGDDGSADADGGSEDKEDATVWSHHVDPKTNRSYYHNSATGETTWHRPKALSGRGGSKAFQTEAADAVDKLLADLVKNVQRKSREKRTALTSSIDFALDEELVARRSTESSSAIRETLADTVATHLDELEAQLLAAQARHFAGFTASLGLR